MIFTFKNVDFISLSDILWCNGYIKRYCTVKVAHSRNWQVNTDLAVLKLHRRWLCRLVPHNDFATCQSAFNVRHIMRTKSGVELSGTKSWGIVSLLLLLYDNTGYGVIYHWGLHSDEVCKWVWVWFQWHCSRQLIACLWLKNNGQTTFHNILKNL